MSRNVLDALRSEWFWLPPNITWKDITNGPHKKYVYAEINDFWYQIPLTLLLLALRYWTEKYIFVPLGKYLGLQDKKIRKITSNPILAAAYKCSPKLTDPCGLAKQSDMSEREVERWWRLRRSLDKPTKLVKFCETSWKATFLFASAGFGLYLVLDKDWFWDIEKIFIAYPNHGVSQGEWWYYMLNASFYWLLIITHSRDVRHKDFWQMMAHHFCTVAMILGSWALNFYRIGMAILPLQDSSEALLQLTKSVNYVNSGTLPYALFTIFLVWWVVERLYIYPVHFMWVLYDSEYKYYNMRPVGLLIFILLCLIMALHLWWSWLIILIVRDAVYKKKKHDVRSSESEISESDHDKETVNKK